MSPSEFRDARLGLGLSLWQLAYLLSLEGSRNWRRSQIEAMETGSRPIAGPVSRLLTAYVEGYRPADWDDVVSGRLRPTTESDFARS